MIVSTLLCILAMIGLINGLMTWWGSYLNINNPPLTVQLLVGYICYPIAFLLGVPRDGDLYKVAQLIGVKVIAVSFTFLPPLPLSQFQSIPTPLLFLLTPHPIPQNEYVAFTDLTHDATYATLSPRSRLIATYALCGKSPSPLSLSLSPSPPSPFFHFFSTLSN